MSLSNYRKGYAVMTTDLTAYSIKDEDLETCKKYCLDGYVVVEQIPICVGVSFSFYLNPFWKMLWFRYQPFNIFWLHFTIGKVMRHKIGKVVYRAQ